MMVRSLVRHRVALLAILTTLLLLSWRTWARAPRLPDFPKPKPDLANIRYGPHERNVLDLWKAKPRLGKREPAPLVIFFHGGAFQSGDKSHVPGWLLVRCLTAGISVASANYRLTDTAPFPAPMLDGARAIQFLRFRADDLGIDPNRIAASGSSAGAGIALWIGFHDDLANPLSHDLIDRQSTRLTCLGVDGAQTSYDPRFIKQIVGGRAHEHTALKPFFGLSDAELELPKAHRLYESASPINHVSAGDPPVILFYTEPNEPLPADAKPGQGIHHPNFGAALKAKLDPLHIECITRHTKDFPRLEDRRAREYREMADFFARQFHVPTQ